MEGEGLGGAVAARAGDRHRGRPCGVVQGDPEFAVDDLGLGTALGVFGRRSGLRAPAQGRVKVPGNLEARRACVRRHQQPGGVDADVHAALP